MAKAYLIFLFIFCGFLRANSQEIPHVRHFTPTDYRAANQNWSITQDQNGWMKIGNNEGVLEFDGARWETLPASRGNTIRTVAIGKQNQVFTGSFGDFGYYTKGTNGWEYISLAGQIHSDLLEKEEIWHILVSKQYVYFQSFSTIYRYDYEKVTTITPPSSIMFLDEVHEKVYVQSIENELYELLPQGQFEIVPGTEGLKGKIVQFVVAGPESGLLIGTRDHGIYWYIHGKMSPWNPIINQTLSQMQLNKGVQLRDGGWAFGTILGGVYLYDTLGRVTGHLSRSNGLQNNTVLSLLQDRDGSLWIGMDKGIDVVQLASPLRFYIDQDGQTGATYTAAVHRDLLYLGTNQGVFAKKRNDPSADFRLVEGAQGQAWDLRVIDGRLYCGHNNGTFEIDGYQSHLISSLTGGWKMIPIANHERLWVQATYTGLGLFRWDEKGRRLVYEQKVEGFQESLMSIAFDSEGYLWGARPNRGVFRIKLSADGHTITEVRRITAENGIPSDRKVVFSRWNNHFLLQCDRGIYEIIARKGGGFDFNPFALLAERSEGQTRKVLFEIGGSAMVSHEDQVQVFGAKDTLSLPLKLIRDYESIIHLGNGEALICLENGYSVFNLASWQNATNAQTGPCAPPLIKELLLDGKSISLQAENSTISLPASFRSLKIRLASMQFDYSPVFLYRLDGLVDQWTEIGPTHEKELASLPSGKWQLRIKSGDCAQETILLIKVQMPCYRQWWMLILYALAGLAGFYFLERYSERKLSEQRSLLDLEKQTELAKQKVELERERLALEVQIKNRELSNATLNLIRKNEMLQKIKDDLHASHTNATEIEKVLRQVDYHMESERDWEILQDAFNQVHDDFFKRLKAQFPDLTPGDLRLCAYLRMNLSSKEIAPLLNISVRGVENKRYRLRSRLGLSDETNLTTWILTY